MFLTLKLAFLCFGRIYLLTWGRDKGSLKSKLKIINRTQAISTWSSKLQTKIHISPWINQPNLIIKKLKNSRSSQTAQNFKISNQFQEEKTLRKSSFFGPQFYITERYLSWEAISLDPGRTTMGYKASLWVFNATAYPALELKSSGWATPTMQLVCFDFLCFISLVHLFLLCSLLKICSSSLFQHICS